MVTFMGRSAIIITGLEQAVGKVGVLDFAGLGISGGGEAGERAVNKVRVCWTAPSTCRTKREMAEDIVAIGGRRDSVIGAGDPAKRIDGGAARFPSGSVTVVVAPL